MTPEKMKQLMANLEVVKKQAQTLKDANTKLFKNAPVGFTLSSN